MNELAIILKGSILARYQYFSLSINQDIIEKQMEKLDQSAKYIWRSDGLTVPNQYVYFRKQFQGNGVEDISLSIAVEGDFVAFLNGEEIGRMQYSDYPEYRTFSKFPAKTRSGKNELLVLNYYKGRDFLNHRCGNPGILAVLESPRLKIATDETWEWTPSGNFQSGEMDVVTVQLGFTFKYDAAKPRFGDWRNVISGNPDSLNLSRRPIPPLELGQCVHGKLLERKLIYRSGEKESFAESVLNDCVVETNENGERLIFALGGEVTGLLEFSLTAGEGTIIDVSHGEHLRDGKVRNFIDGRKFTDRYICRSGKNYFQMPFRRFGAKFLQLNITNATEKVDIDFVGLRPVRLPLPEEGSFACSRKELNVLHQASIKTLICCMHEHYEDCPWREQGLYAYDSRNQALYGYYVWGNYEFAASSIRLLGRGARPDGWLELCAPSRFELTIPMFSMVWVSMLKDYYFHSGKDDLFKEMEPVIKRIIDLVKKNFNSEKSLYIEPSERGLWPFYEWAGELDGTAEHSVAGYFQGEGKRAEELDGTAEHCQAGRLSILYNLYFVEMLQSYSAMLRWSGRQSEALSYENEADSLAKAVDCRFWDEAEGCYAAFERDGNLSGYFEHVQYLAIYLNMPSRKNFEHLKLKLAKESLLVPCTFSPLYYLAMGQKQLDLARLDKYITDSFMPMIEAGADTLWETPLGSEDFGGAGSCCHGWSSLPVFYNITILGGITVAEPGWRKVRISPKPTGCESLHISIPTPLGKLILSGQKVDSTWKFHVTSPAEMEIVIDSEYTFSLSN